MDMILLRPSIPRDTSIRSSGRNIGTIAGFGGFGPARTTRSAVSGGAEHARWVFDYNPDEDDDDEAGYRFGTHAFLPGEYVSISGRDGKLHTFRVITVNPVVLSVDLVKSFELEIKV
jgi:hypothetical protein